jgi:hypothetical protein
MRYLINTHKMNAYRAGHVRLSARFNSKTAGRIWMKFGMDVGFEVLTAASMTMVVFWVVDRPDDGGIKDL